jgi:hypothetical protein
MGEPLRFSEDAENQSDQAFEGADCQRPTPPSIASSGLANTLGAFLEGLLSGLWRLEEVSQGLDNLVARLPAGETRQQIKHLSFPRRSSPCICGSKHQSV